MGASTYRARALVLKRTKLGEADVICTLLAEDGSQIKAVAKGARKPTSSFTSRLELFSACDLLLVEGKSLDIIKEARLVESNAPLRSRLELTEAASPMVELVERATLVSLENKQLYPLTTKALHFLTVIEDDQLLTFTAAHLLKTVSFLGFKPELERCIGCGSPDVLKEADERGLSTAFSYLDGGVVCSSCLHNFETVMVDPCVLHWAQALLYSTFEEIQQFDLPSDLQIALLRFLQTWIKQHIGSNLKSLTFLFSYGLPN